MSKLSFRARALDASKPMPIYLSEELPDLPEYLSINRSVPQMPSGMEKEEESERHLQEAISTGKVIPTPEIFSLVDMNHSDRFDLLYPAKFKPPKQYIHYQSYSFDSDVAEYDMDSEDEAWLNAQSAKMGCIITADQFEEMMDRLEKGSGQQVVTLKEAKLLVPEDDELVVAVYDYWLNKRLQLQQYPLIPVVKTEKAVGNTQSANPYVAFRRRLEKMQTRKNRKNDEVSYEKMLKLRRDLSRAVTILEMIKRREKMKTEHLRLTVDIFERRHAVGDYSGQLVSDMSWHKWQRVISTSGSTLSRCSSAAPARPSFTYPSSNASVSSPHCRPQWPLHSPRINSDHKSKRSYKKRKHGRTHSSLSRSPASYLGGVCSAGDVVIDMLSSDEEDRCGSRAGRCRLPSVPAAPAPTLTTSQSTDYYQQEHEPDGEFTFRRKRGCHYHEPVSWWQNGEFAVAPVSLPSIPRRFQLGTIRQSLGLVRRRLGRGGRVIVDRACGGSMDDLRELGVDVQLEGCLSLDDMRQYAPSDAVSLLSDGATITNTDCLLSSPAAATSSCQLSSGCSQFELRPSHSAMVAPSSTSDVTHLLTALSLHMSPASCSAPLLSMTQSFNGSATPPSPPSVHRQTLSVAQCGVAVRPSCQHKSGPPLPADTPDQLHLSLPSPIAHTDNHISEVTDVCKDKHITVSTQPLIKVKQLPLDAS